MTPEEIKRHFGEDALNMLYDCMLDNPVHVLADWILLLTPAQEIAEWITDLRTDQEETE